jgi:hypothetical protein
MPRYFPCGGRWAGRRATTVLLLGLLPLALACGSVTDSLLEADDPDIISPDKLNSPSAALALRIGALERFRDITAGDESTWLFGGLLADEWGTSSTFVQNDETDQRRIQVNNSSITDMYRRLNRVRTATNQAIAALNTHFPDSSAAIAEMYFARGFAEMQLAQDFCGSIPLSDASGDEVVYAPGSTTDEVFERAVASYDSALALVGAATSGHARTVARAARVGKARAQLGLEMFAEAGALVTESEVPTSFTYSHTFAITSGDNIIWAQGASARRYLVGDSLEGNARDLYVANNLPFFSAGDPRLPARYTISSTSGDTTRSQDGLTYSRTTTLYARSTTIAVANGIDARLIEAEAALQADNPTGMLDILNALRAAPPPVGTVTPTAGQLPPLALPATREEQIDLLFREKAFWTFSRGQRLGDLRRLVRQYGRTQDQVFPTGAHYRGGEYGTDVNLPVPQEEDNNPAFGSAGRAACVASTA